MSPSSTVILYWLTRFVGFVASLKVPSFFVLVFAKAFGINLEESEKNISEYPTLNAFFTRALKPGVRPIHPSSIVVSPVDARVLEFGAIHSGQLFQAKGLSYSLKELVKLSSYDLFFDGFFATFYLSPKDCHRIFSPVSGEIVQSCLIGGKLLPVREPYISNHPNLYAENERLVTIIKTDLGHVGVVKVGALNVASISVTYDETLFNPKHTSTYQSRIYSPAPKISRGDHLGTFHLGSTVILLVEKKMIAGFNFTSDYVRYGEGVVDVR